MVRRVFLIRHCQSEANRDHRAETHGDSALTELGVEQARRRALTLADHELAAVTIVASPLMRAARTAHEIASRHGWELTHDARLIEGSLGRLEGLSYEEIMALVPQGETWVSADAHGGESIEVVGERMLGALTDALNGAPGDLIVVSHGYAISALLARLGQPALGIANGDMLELDIGEEITVHRVAHHPLDTPPPSA
jgi:broad specificity phosphatase PhoE